MIAAICSIAMQLGGPTCLEAVSIAAIESRLSPTARGRHGEVGLFQIRPKYFGKVSADPTTQIRQGIQALGIIKARCQRDLTQNWVMCWNVGVQGALRLKGSKPGPYRLKYILMAQLMRAELIKLIPDRRIYEFASLGNCGNYIC